MAEPVLSSKISSDIHLLLVGKSGNGITSIVNTILWKNPPCHSTLDQITKEINTYNGIIGTQKCIGRKLTVIDTAGICETKTKVARTNLIQNMSKAMEISPNGFNAIVIVLKYGSRLSEEDKTIFRFIKSIFGEQVYTKYCILVMTHGDNFKCQKGSLKLSNFEEWIRNQTGTFETLLRDCCNRIILFDNYSEDEKETLTDQLVLLIDTLKATPYTMGDYQRAATSRLSILKELKIPRWREKIFKSKQSLFNDFIKANRQDNDNIILDLEIIHYLAKQLQEKFTQKLKGTDIKLEEIKLIEEFIDKISKDLLKYKDKKQCDIESARNIQKAEKEEMETRLINLQDEIKTLKATITLTKTSEKCLIAECTKSNEAVKIGKQKEENLCLELKKKQDEIQKQLNEIKILKEKLEEGEKNITQSEEKRKQAEEKVEKTETLLRIELKQTQTHVCTINKLTEQIQIEELNVENLEKRIAQEKQTILENQNELSHLNQELQLRLKEIQSLNENIRNKDHKIIEAEETHTTESRNAKKKYKEMKEKYKSDLKISQEQMEKARVNYIEDLKKLSQQHREEIPRSEIIPNATIERLTQELNKEIDLLQKTKEQISGLGKLQEEIKLHKVNELKLENENKRLQSENARLQKEIDKFRQNRTNKPKEENKTKMDKDQNCSNM
ncbi:CAP-Gly domain-containing linker protein 1-like [Physella acuta]|uniref:CAP-Gly domain-containing linker protein 1-like n=1 Tax=Physella acuta TaxID=109671 RepID=UPI0027DD52A1|nr:CAP-Gly domain-containing linker protein 1-like [Physella acuta]XP_059159862.1 CAP-Gly domain-containing linker protein 1-like [Physella acuta]